MHLIVQTRLTQLPLIPSSSQSPWDLKDRFRRIAVACSGYSASPSADRVLIFPHRLQSEKTSVRWPRPSWRERGPKFVAWGSQWAIGLLCLASGQISFSTLGLCRKYATKMIWTSPQVITEKSIFHSKVVICIAKLVHFLAVSLWNSHALYRESGPTFLGKKKL